MSRRIFRFWRILLLVPMLVLSAQDAGTGVAGYYSGQYQGGSSGTFTLKIEPGTGGAWKCEVTFTLSGETVKTTMRECHASASDIEAVYDFEAQGFALRSHITGKWNAKGVEGSYKTTTTDGAADVDQGIWSASKR